MDNAVKRHFLTLPLHTQIDEKSILCSNTDTFSIIVTIIPLLLTYNVSSIEINMKRTEY